MYIRHEIGEIGENIATKYLKQNGYKIIERNFIAKHGEIDIIARDKNEIVFIEVKTRTNGEFGKPIDAVNNIKQKHLKQAVKYYIYKNNLENEYIRLDVIEVYYVKSKTKINHIKQII